MTVGTEELASIHRRLGRLRLEIGSEISAMSRHSSSIAASFSRLADSSSGATSDRYRKRVPMFEAQSSSCRAVADALLEVEDHATSAPSLPSTVTALRPLPEHAAELRIEDLVDPDSPAALLGSAMARALVTSRGFDDTGDYLELLAELRTQLEPEDGGGDGDEHADYIVSVVASLALIGAVLTRSAERSGLRTESGQPILAELFQRLTDQGVNL